MQVERGFNLCHMVKFKTWSRMVDGNERSSILNHIYLQDPTKYQAL